MSIKCKKLIGLLKAQKDLESAKTMQQMVETGKVSQVFPDGLDYDIDEDVNECQTWVAAKTHSVENCAKQKGITCEDCQK